jgi:membrane-associated phospholipid phosphatase
VKTLRQLTHATITTVFAGVSIFFATPMRAREPAREMSACLTLECAAAAPKTYSFDEPLNDQPPSQQPSGQTEAPPKAAANPDHVREGLWRKLPGNFVQDQKDMWVTYPRKLVTGHYLLPTALVAAGTAAFIASDHQTAPYFRQTDFFQDSDRALGSKVSGGVIAGIPTAFYVVSLLRHDSYGQGTSLLAGEAVVDDTILMIVTKAITRRLRPSDVALNGDYAHTFFKSNAGPLGKASSFPSGHAMMSFSIATIFAHRYREHHWVPWVAYGVATAISFSRITTGAHFPSDVFFGAATGFAIARYSVLHGQ